MAKTEQVWEVLLRHLLVGVNQQPMDEQLQQALLHWRIQSDEPDQVLLEGVGRGHLLRQAQMLTPFTGAWPSAVTADNRQPCSWRSMQHLDAILAGHHTPALPEFARLLQTYEKALPPAALPDLLKKSLSDNALWQLLEPLLDERAQWLIQLHPSWRQLLPAEEDLTNWHQREGRERQELFQHFRQIDPAAARISLQAKWSNFKPKLQGQLLETMRVGLSEEDVPFLEECLQTNRKEVRIPAGKRLASLPDSDYVKRCEQELGRYLRMEKGKLVIEIPVNIPKSAREWGIYPTGSKARGGLKANYVMQLFSRVPLARLLEKWTITPAKLIDQLGKQEQALAWQNTLLRNLLRYPNEAGNRALVRWWLLSAQEVYWNQPAAKELLSGCSNETFNTLLVDWLQQYGPLVPANTLAAYWLGIGEHTWTPALSKFVVLGFRDVIQSRRTADWNLFHYRSILEVAAYQSEVELFDAFRAGWQFRQGHFGRWHSDVEKLLQTMHFRREMQRAMAEG